VVQFLRKKTNVDNKARLRYLDGYWFRTMNVSTCCVSAEDDTRFTVFNSSVSNKQLINFPDKGCVFCQKARTRSGKDVPQSVGLQPSAVLPSRCGIDHFPNKALLGI
jgi:hypothetical protein